jgi:predicted small secreted protein
MRMHETIHAVLRPVTLVLHDTSHKRLHLLILEPQLLALQTALVRSACNTLLGFGRLDSQRDVGHAVLWPVTLTLHDATHERLHLPFCRRRFLRCMRLLCDLYTNRNRICFHIMQNHDIKPLMPALAGAPAVLHLQLPCKSSKLTLCAAEHHAVHCMQGLPMYS